MEDLKSLNSKLPENAIIFGTKPSVISFYSRRLSVKPPGTMDTQILNRIFNKENNRESPIFFYMLAFTSPSFPQPYYPLKEIADRIETVNVAKMQNGDNSLVIAILARPKQ